MAIYWMGAFVFCNRNGFLKAVFKSDVCAYLRIIFSSTLVQNMEQVHYLENNCSELMLKIFYECLAMCHDHCDCFKNSVFLFLFHPKIVASVLK
jgi:hypothetical protein